MTKAVCCLLILIYQSSVVITREYHPSAITREYHASAGLPPMPVKDKPMQQIKQGIRDMSDVINDMKDAFSIVCSVDQFKTIAPKMFNMTNPNPTYSFKIFEKTMRKFTYKRDDFEKPNFPNLTRAYMHLTRMVRSNTSLAEKQDKLLFSTSNTMEAEESVQIPSFVRNEKLEPRKQNSSSNDWNFLGLPGWEGKITSNFALDFMERKVDSPAMTSSAPHQAEPSKFKIIGSSNLPPTIKAINEKGRQPSRYYEAMIRNSSRFRSKPFTDALQSSTDAGIYIARANDPFGKSTKWHLRNSSNSVYDREKRSAPELYSMVQCATKCDPLLFKGYGCYCGFLGSGKPTDGVDYCCYLHDKCYERSSCPSFLEYFVPYLWKCYRGRPLCALDHGEWGGPGSCATKLCQCDLLLSKCLRKYGCPKKRNICKTSAVRILQTFLMFA